MNNDLISREALNFELRQQLAYQKEKAKLTTINADKMAYSLVATGIQLAIDIIDNAPSVEYSFYQEAYQTGYEEGKNERPQGEWSFNPYDSCSYCSVCMVKAPFGYKNFCPNCGAKMKGGET